MTKPIRIATLNIWNHPSLPERLPALVSALALVNADLLALQEVPSASPQGGDYAHLLADEVSRRLGSSQPGYSHVYFRPYPDDPEEGLAVLSRFPLLETAASWESGDEDPPLCAIYVTAALPGTVVGLANLHLDWESALRREVQIAGLTAWLERMPASRCLLAGDFNAAPESSVYRFLAGQESLLGRAVSPAWVDLAASYAAQTGSLPQPTLDFLANPRWAAEGSLEVPRRCDWLLYQQALELSWPRLLRAGVFGDLPPIPSDHNGVFADLRF
jgi:maltose 6'-phosphate phosphatase